MSDELDDAIDKIQREIDDACYYLSNERYIPDSLEKTLVMLRLQEALAILSHMK